MRPPPHERFRRLLRPAAAIGAAALVAALILSLLQPLAALGAYRFAAFACFQPAAGSLIFLLIFRSTGGQWGDSLLPFLRAGARLVPWIWPLIAWLAIVPGNHAAWTSPDARPLPGPWVLLARAAGYELVFLVLRHLALTPRLRGYSGLGLIVYAFAGHFLAADWFFTLEPGWYSSAFPLVWMGVQASAGIALAIVAASFYGRDPSETGPKGRALGKDWGDLLLTAVLFSSYVAFMELLITWSGNLPREITWFYRRSHGGWVPVTCALAFFHLFFPLGWLLSNRRKRSRYGVPVIAGVVCGAEVLWAIWLILPAFTDRGILLWPTAAAFLAAGAGLFVNRYGAVVLAGSETA